MSTLQPIPFADLIRRVFYEYKRYGKIFGVSEDKFFSGVPGIQLGVQYIGKEASTPLGPAAGPHTQLAQNIVLAWLTGSRILELKTVHPPGDLQAPHPSIDSENIGFNVAWSQDLTLDQSLREYVKARMLIDIIKQSELLGEEFSRLYGDTIFDFSIGYNFKSMKSERIHAYLRELKDAQNTIDELRNAIPEEYAEYKSFDYNPHIIDSVTLSLFNSCSSEEIDNIVSYLLTEHHLNVIIKLNPTLLGPDELSYVLYDVLGYHDIKLDRETFKKNLRFDQALKLFRNMFHTAASCGRTLGLKLTNTLAVKNHKDYFTDDVMYMSGPPLYALALQLLQNIRQALGDIHSHIPMSFSAGVDGENFPDVMSLNLVPVTVCTDLLKAPGYAKLQLYLQTLGEYMQQVEAINISDYIMKRFNHEIEAINDVFTKLHDEVQQIGQQLPDKTREATIHEQLQIFTNLYQRVMTALKENNDSLELLTTDALIVTDTLTAYNQKFGENFLIPHTFKELYRNILAAAAGHNLESLLERTLEDPRYTYAKNKRVPKKLPSELSLYNCTSCGRCIAICPNNANFAYHVSPMELNYSNYQYSEGHYTEIPGGQFVLEKFYQVANLADSCNECGVCAIHCVEHGKPYTAKPKYFRSQEYWEECPDIDGFFVEKEEHLESIIARIQRKEYRLWHNTQTNQITFADGIIEAIFMYPDILERIMPLMTDADGHVLDMKMYFILFTQLKGVFNDENCNYINIQYV